MHGAASCTWLRAAVSKDEAPDSVPRPSKRALRALLGTRRKGSADHAHDVGLLHDQEVIAVDLDFGARPLAEQHAIAWLEVDGDELAGLIASARADCDDLAL